MVSGSRIEGGSGTQNLSAGVRKTIQSIKEIVGNHSDADIYVALKETNMDPNETAQKLLNQDPFHEVKRKKDKKKEGTSFEVPVPVKPSKPTEQLVQGMKFNTYNDRNPRTRRAGYGWNKNAPGVTKEFRVVRDNRINQNGHRATKHSAKEPLISNVPEKSSAETSKNLKLPTGHRSSGSELNDRLGGKRSLVSNVAPPHDSLVGVYSSSSDPVHIPAANVGATKREIGAVGVRRHTSENHAKLSSVQASSVSNSQFKSFPATSQSNVSESTPRISAGRSLNNQYSSRPHQHLTAHQKAPQANKEWKPKSSQKPSATDLGVIGTPKKSASSPANNSKDLATDAARLQDKLPLESPRDDQNVIIAAHIRVSETDRCRLTFGSLGIEHVEPNKSSHDSGYQEARHVEESLVEPLPSSPDSSSDESSDTIQVALVDERNQSSDSISPASEQQSSDRLDSSELQQQQQASSSELPFFSQAYDPQTGYDISYFRPSSDESVRGQVLQIPQEIPATTIPMVQQQPPVAQMYPQVHLPHFANIMPYRQFLSPVYVPPMVMPGYSNSPTYSPHPSSGSSYVLMPGANSPQVSPNGLKFAIPQFKSLQAGSPTGFGNFTTPSGLPDHDPSRLKYKDGNVYLPNPQGETSELWMNPRDISSLQSASYYNMAGQTPHAAYLPSHGAQSSHMQFSGLYHPPQPAAIANPHHMGPNIGVGAPGNQVGGYQQQPQLSQLSWTGNF